MSQRVINKLLRVDNSMKHNFKNKKKKKQLLSHANIKNNVIIGNNRIIIHIMY